jgi:hypothetical protein
MIIAHMRRISSIKQQFQEQGIRWTVLEEDTDGYGGTFLFLHRELNEACIYDLWFETVEQAEEEAFSRYGISKGDWENQTS